MESAYYGNTHNRICTFFKFSLPCLSMGAGVGNITWGRETPLAIFLLSGFICISKASNGYSDASVICFLHCRE